MLTDCIKRKLIGKNNCAFQKNRSAENIYLNLAEKIYRAFQNGHFLELVFMDLKSAYDSVWINGLLYKLIKKYKYDGNIIAWLIEYLKGRYTRVRYNGINTIWRLSRDCLPQGDQLSVILFPLFINGVNVNQKQGEIEIKIKSSKMEKEVVLENEKKEMMIDLCELKIKKFNAI